MGLKNLLGLGGKFKDESLNESFTPNFPVLGTINPATGEISNFGAPEGNFIGDSFYDTGGVFGSRYNNAGLLEVERSYILQQRAISIYPEVAIGIEEIMRDLFDKLDPVTLNIKNPSDKDEKIHEAFNEFKERPFEILGDSKTPRNLLFFNLLKQVYIDGHMIIMACEAPKDFDSQPDFYKPFKPVESKEPATKENSSKFLPLNESMVHGYHLEKDSIGESKKSDYVMDIEALIESNSSKKSKKSKAKDTKIVFIPLDPARVTLDYQTNYIMYDLRRGNQIPLDPERVIMADFGLYDIMGARYGFLQYAFKYANQLQSLQDMLVPMRFRRSIARRVFNVDVGKLPQARATEYMQGLQSKFKYKKSYDIRNGRVVSDERETVGLVEDYWFSSRDGGKGTSVDMIDEAGNFADSLEDILYFNKKLYQSMFIPLRRVFESDADYDYTNSSIEVDELRFHSFLERLRFVYGSVLTRMFQIYLVANGTLDEHEVSNIEVLLKYDNWFAENKKFERFEKSLGLFDDALEKLGKAFSAETMMQSLFGMSSSDVKTEYEKIKSELEEDSIYFHLYAAKEEQ